MARLWQWGLRASVFLVLLVPFWVVAGGVARRPPQTAVEQPLFRGIHYRRTFRSTPRPVMLHVVRVDLTAPGLAVLVTPGRSRSLEWETNARTTSAFLREFGLQLAVNANFFHPFAENTPWDYYPREGDRVGVVGQAIANQVEYGPPLKSWPVLCFLSNQARILQTEQCPEGTRQAVSGSAVLVLNGRPTPPEVWGQADRDQAYSRTAIALDRSGKTLWIIAIDDKQWRYSEGVTLAELGEIAIAQGADTALNLDGGGSTTLVAATATGPRILNAPIHTKMPMRERPVANHLGFFAAPLAP